MRTESYYHYLTAMQLAKIATYGGKMLDKQDKTIEVIREESEKTRKVLGNIMKDESEYTRKTMKEELDKVDGKIDLLRMDFREYMQESIKIIQDEITEIKRALKKAGILEFCSAKIFNLR